jgi:ElaB/YqjD/DUF883 family membrane-anchored ribosome-binding protein
MAATNQRNRSGGQKVSSPRQSTAKKAVSQVSHTMSDMRDEVAGYVSQGQEQLREMTRDHEARTVIVALAAGFGVGLLIGGALASSHRRPRSWSDRITAEGIGRKFLDRVESMIPEAVAEHFKR